MEIKFQIIQETDKEMRYLSSTQLLRSIYSSYYMAKHTFQHISIHFKRQNAICFNLTTLNCISRKGTQSLDLSKNILSFVTGNYSVAGFELTLRRKISHYIITYYLPSGMFVIVSWISFLVPADIVPGRMTLLVTVFLVLVNIFNTITTNIPKAEGKAK